jgi:hypothetical protein
MKILRTAALGAALCVLATALPASASTTEFQPAKEIALPSGAKGVPEGYLPTLSCVSAGNCVAGGAYENSAGDNVALIATESKGTWGKPTTLLMPNGSANASPTIYGLSCGAANNCVAVGSYQDSAGDVEGFVDDEVNAKWQEASEVELPANALGTGQDALARSIDCSSKGNCAVVGIYLDNAASPNSQGFDVNEIGGTWQRAKVIAFATKPNANPFVSMNQVECSSKGNCTAVGSFIDVNGVGQGLIVSEVHGTWTSAVAVTLPANASAYAGASLGEDACTSTACTVLGTYLTNTGAIEGLVASNAGGSWPRASELAMPASAAANPHVFLYGFFGIACANATNCAAGGQYRDASGNFQGFLVNEVSGVWKSAVTVTLPAGATTTGANGGVVSVTCPRAGDCRAGAAYLDASSNYQALTVTEVNGVWQRGVKVDLPAGATSVGVDGGIYALVCSTVNACTATGSYLQSATMYEGLSVST